MGVSKYCLTTWTGFLRHVGRMYRQPLGFSSLNVDLLPFVEGVSHKDSQDSIQSLLDLAGQP